MTDFGLGWAMRNIDAALRWRQGIFEFAGNPECVLRVSRAEVSRPIQLSGGKTILPGQPVIEVHLWNDHLPPIPDGGTTAAWGNLFKRRLRASLEQLALYIDRDPSCRDVVAITAMPVFPERLGPGTMVRLCERLGWEVVPPRPEEHSPVKMWLHSVLIWMLIRVFNPEGARGRGFVHGRIEIWMTRERLLDRYARDTDMRDMTDATMVQS